MGICSSNSNCEKKEEKGEEFWTWNAMMDEGVWRKYFEEERRRKEERAKRRRSEGGIGGSRQGGRRGGEGGKGGSIGVQEGGERKRRKRGGFSGSLFKISSPSAQGRPGSNWTGGEGGISPFGLACPPGQEQRSEGWRSFCEVTKGVPVSCQLIAQLNLFAFGFHLLTTEKHKSYSRAIY